MSATRGPARSSIAVGGPRPQLELVGLVLAVAVGQLARAGVRLCPLARVQQLVAAAVPRVDPPGLMALV